MSFHLGMCRKLCIFGCMKYSTLNVGGVEGSNNCYLVRPQENSASYLV